MQCRLRKELLHYKRKTISLSDLENMIATKIPTYSSFAKEILALEQEGLLEMVKSRGRNQHSPSLAYHYRINKARLNKDYHAELQSYRLAFHPAINLDSYFSLDHDVWQNDLPYLKRINNYMEQNGFPSDEAPAPERSFELVQDEKWITEGGGSDVLVRIGLWDDLKIMPVSDPLMFAIHPGRLGGKRHLHLIVENKTTYQALLPVLTQTEFSTLIYGSGYKIVKSIENVDHQLPLQGKQRFYYFGDLDRAGITIWNNLNHRKPAVPAYPFYHACLQKTAVPGKTNQRPDPKALQAFFPFFPEKERDYIVNILEEGMYYPQEVLQTKELQQIWREARWSE